MKKRFTSTEIGLSKGDSVRGLIVGSGTKFIRVRFASYDDKATHLYTTTRTWQGERITITGSGSMSGDDAGFQVNGVNRLLIFYPPQSVTPPYQMVTSEKWTIYIDYVGEPEVAPTYLETLDKLDQWSSAQYIPNSGNELNL